MLILLFIGKCLGCCLVDVISVTVNTYSLETRVKHCRDILSSCLLNMTRENQEIIKELSIPLPGYEDLSFPTKYSQNFYNQCVANLWKQYISYWKNQSHNALRYFMTVLNGLVFGTVFWQKGTKLYDPIFLL